MTGASPATHPTAPGHRTRTQCRGCDGTGLEQVLSLGTQPLANALPASPAEFAGERRYPLGLYLCTDCGLVQLVDVVDPEVLFREYLYVTGTSATMGAHWETYADQVTALLDLGGDDLVVEVASNDGSLLRRFRDRGVQVLGVEPARNIAELARADGIDTLDLFFGRETAGQVADARGLARAVIGNNVLAHVDDPAGFLAGAASLIRDDGLVIVEVPYLDDLANRLEYDTVYHEHLSYFAVAPMLPLYAGAALSILRVDHVPVHGGSIRVYAGHRSRHADHAPAVHAQAEREREAGLQSLDRWHRFAGDVAASRRQLLQLLDRLRAEGQRVAAYGAPAKGNTLLNYCGIGPDLVAYTVDRNPLKVGRYTPGTHLPVRPYEGTFLEDRPDYALLLAWNFAEEIQAQPQERAWADSGGRFILPLPTPRLL